MFVFASTVGVCSKKRSIRVAILKQHLGCLNVKRKKEKKKKKEKKRSIFFNAIRPVG